MKVKYLDPRADNYFGYDKENQVWILVQTWHILVHIIKTRKDKYELHQWRAGIKYEKEPTDDELKDFAKQSEQMLAEAMKAGIVTVLDDKGEPCGVKRFNRWFIKDFREG